MASRPPRRARRARESEAPQAQLEAPQARLEAADRPGPAAGHDLLAWYRRHHRSLPWRVPPGARTRPDPYRVWLSEVMLQQTTVAAVIPYFHAFLDRWPTVDALAAAPIEDVLAAWAGLGYYSRARNLKACADTVVAEHGGRFPDTAADLAALPGIGAYTSAAIAAIAFGRRSIVIDGNVERVAARLLALDQPPKEVRGTVEAAIDAMLPAGTDPGDFAQATMDLGATICTPRKPACAICPLRPHCQASANGLAEALPVKAAKAARPTRAGAAFVAVRADGAVLVRRRAPKGLLGGMLEVPGTEWTEGYDPASASASAPLKARWRPLPERARHVFTHFALELDVFRADVPAGTRAPAGGAWWLSAEKVPEEALPTLMRKVVSLACPEIAAAEAPNRRRARI